MNTKVLIKDIIDVMQNTSNEKVREVISEIRKFGHENINDLNKEQLLCIASILGLEINEGGFMSDLEYELEEVSISSHKDFIKNKKVDYRVYTSISALSNREPGVIGSRYIYLDKIERNLKEISDVLDISVSMLRKHIRTLKKLNAEQFALEEYNGKLIYRLNYSDEDGKNFVTIPIDNVRILLNGLSNNCIKLYTVLLWTCRNGERALTQDWLAEQIGLSKSTKKAVKYNIEVLEKCGLIKVRREYETDRKADCSLDITSYQKIKHYYSLKG